MAKTNWMYSYFDNPRGTPITTYGEDGVPHKFLINGFFKIQPVNGLPKDLAKKVLDRMERLEKKLGKQKATGKDGA